MDSLAVLQRKVSQQCHRCSTRETSYRHCYQPRSNNIPETITNNLNKQAYYRIITANIHTYNIYASLYIHYLYSFWCLNAFRTLCRITG